jgi:hypothetical protein
MKVVAMRSAASLMGRGGHICWTCFKLFLVFLCVVALHDLLPTFLKDHSPPSAVPSNKSSKNESIFIASLHWNDEALIRSHWTPGILEIVRHFGAGNVYISIIESGSWDGTKDALTELDVMLKKMGVERSIEMRNSMHEEEVNHMPGIDEKGWVWTSRGRKELRRIPYLVELRNQVMAKLKPLAMRIHGGGMRHFDKVLWLNDVIFTVRVSRPPFNYIEIRSRSFADS